MRGRTFKQSMLEYCKIILLKISFDRRLFRKEYRKTFNYLDKNEHGELKKWLRTQMKMGDSLLMDSTGN
jgi:hypothetical protein